MELVINRTAAEADLLITTGLVNLTILPVIQEDEIDSAGNCRPGINLCQSSNDE